MDYRKRLNEIITSVAGVLERFDNAEESFNDTMYYILEQRRCAANFIATLPSKSSDNYDKKLNVDAYVVLYSIDRTMKKLIEDDMEDLIDSSHMRLDNITDRNIEKSIQEEYNNLLGGI